MPKNGKFFGFAVVVLQDEEARPVEVRYETKVESGFDPERVINDTVNFLQAEGIFVERESNKISVSACKSNFGDGLAEYLNKLHRELDFVRLLSAPLVQPGFIISFNVQDNS